MTWLSSAITELDKVVSVTSEHFFPIFELDPDQKSVIISTADIVLTIYSSCNAILKRTYQYTCAGLDLEQVVVFRGLVRELFEMVLEVFSRGIWISAIIDFISRTGF